MAILDYLRSLLFGERCDERILEELRQLKHIKPNKSYREILLWQIKNSLTKEEKK